MDLADAPPTVKDYNGIPLIIFPIKLQTGTIAGLTATGHRSPSQCKVNGKSLWGIDRGVDDGPSEMVEHWGGQILLMRANTTVRWGDKCSAGLSCKTYWVDGLWRSVWAVFQRYWAFNLLFFKDYLRNIAAFYKQEKVTYRYMSKTHHYNSSQVILSLWKRPPRANN